MTIFKTVKISKIYPTALQCVSFGGQTVVAGEQISGIGIDHQITQQMLTFTENFQPFRFWRAIDFPQRSIISVFTALKTRVEWYFFLSVSSELGKDDSCIYTALKFKFSGIFRVDFEETTNAKFHTFVPFTGFPQNWIDNAIRTRILTWGTFWNNIDEFVSVFYCI